MDESTPHFGVFGSSIFVKSSSNEEKVAELAQDILWSLLEMGFIESSFVDE